MRFKQIGNKQDICSVVIKNAESSSSIPAGTPVCLVLNGTEDGVSVVLPATAAAIKGTSAIYGIALGNYAAGSYGETQIFGICHRVIYSRARTRAASTDSYSTVAAEAVGNLMQIDTINNALAIGASVAASNFAPIAVLAETLASAAGVASTSSATHVASYVTGYCKAFLRMM